MIVMIHTYVPEGQAVGGSVVGLGHVGQGEHVSTEGKIVGHVGHVGGGKVGQVEQGVPGVREFTIKK